MTRLQHFRAFMARMNPVADPGMAIKEGLYVEPPGRSVAAELALRLELEPASTHLVLGGTGSGKTTAVLRAQEKLRRTLSEAGDHVEYIDVIRRHDLAVSELSGVLVALAGLALAEAVVEPDVEDPAVARAIEAIRRHAHGYRQWIDPSDYDYDRGDPDDGSGGDMEPFDVPGTLVSPDRPVPDRLEALVPHLTALRTARLGNEAQVVFLFDSLDRLPSPERFREAVQDDLRVLKAAGVGAVVVGPIRFIAANDRAVTDLFDYTHFQLPPDPDKAEEMAFLTSVLRRRAGADVLPDDCLEPLARASGGVMRDLIQLAKGAASEAYYVGHEPMMPADVAHVADVFGRGLAVGLDDEQVKKLKHLHRRGGFVIRSERELSLIETRRVLFYGQSRWKVHPALAPLLSAIPEAA